MSPIFDKAKIGTLVKGAAKNASGIAQVVSIASENKGKSKAKAEEPSTTSDSLKIETIEQLQDSLLSLQGEMSPAMLQVIKSQMQVLDSISSPTMTGMMIDNLVLGLKQSLKEADSETMPVIRESFIRLIQNFVFMAEAKMHYIVDKNKEEATRLLAESGKMMSNTFIDIACIAIPAGEAGKIVKAMKKDLFTIKPATNGDLFSNMMKMVNVNKTIKEKQKEFYDTIENLFDTFDKYPDLFEKNIVINGMLSKYRKVLVERFTDEKVRLIKNRKSINDLQRISSLSSEITSILSGKGLNAIRSGGKSALSVFLGRKAIQYDLRTYFMLYDTFEVEVSELKKNLHQETDRLQKLKEDRKKIGMLRFSEKKESAANIDAQLLHLEECKKELRMTENKLKEFKEVFPEAHAVKDEINRYEAKLKAVEEKYLC